jgi:hypothetical protein
MTKALAYRRHAARYRKLANSMSHGAQRAEIIGIAVTWEQLASDRAERLAHAKCGPQAPTPAATSVQTTRGVCVEPVTEHLRGACSGE